MGTVYMVRDASTGLVRIGFTVSVKHRAYTIPYDHRNKLAGHLLRMEVIEDDTSRELETLLHRKLRHLYTDGEWFRPPTGLQAFIQRMTALNRMRAKLDAAITAEKPPT